ncbi:MAG: hypothetical protein WKH64_02620 [Chloroflexia bacterium]
MDGAPQPAERRLVVAERGRELVLRCGKAMVQADGLLKRRTGGLAVSGDSQRHA